MESTEYRELRTLIETGFAQVNVRLDRHEQLLVTHDARLKKHDARFDQHDARFDRHDARFDQYDARFDGLEALIRRESPKTRDYVDLKAAETRRHFDVVAERLEGQIRLIAEGHQALTGRQDSLERRIDGPA